jgi:CRISPR-associated protein Csm3
MADALPRLVKKVFIDGEMEVLTGLHIGGPFTGITAGAADALVVREPVGGRPYVPASALRGKLRHLLERLGAGTGADAAGDDAPQTDAERLFGSTRPGRAGHHRRGRLIVRDGMLVNADWLDARPGLDLPYTEIKHEAAIDRLTAAPSPRQVERVPAGARFALALILDVMEGDDEGGLAAATFRALALLEDDYLGGHGGRGYGQVRVAVRALTEKDRETYAGGGDARPTTLAVPARLRHGA